MYSGKYRKKARGIKNYGEHKEAGKVRASLIVLTTYQILKEFAIRLTEKQLKA